MAVVILFLACWVSFNQPETGSQIFLCMLYSSSDRCRVLFLSTRLLAKHSTLCLMDTSKYNLRAKKESRWVCPFSREPEPLFGWLQRRANRKTTFFGGFDSKKTSHPHPHVTRSSAVPRPGPLQFVGETQRGFSPLWPGKSGGNGVGGFVGWGFVGFWWFCPTCFPLFDGLAHFLACFSCVRLFSGAVRRAL